MPDGKHFLSSGADRTVRLWELDSGRELCCFEGHSGRVRSIALAPGGRVVSGGFDASLALWKLPGAEYKKTVEVAPKDARYHVNLGNALAGQGKRDEAIAEYRKATELDPKGDYAYYRLGVVLREKGDLDGALAEFRRACMVNPFGWGARGELFPILARRGQLKETQEFRAAWQKALEKNPPEHGAWSGYAELCLFLGLDEEYRRHRPLLLARFGGTTDPVIAERVSRTCLLLPASGDELQRAAALADRAAAAGPKHGHFGYSLAAKGLAEYRRERFDRAIDLLQQAGARGVWMPVTRFILPMAQHRSGQTRQAQESLGAACSPTTGVRPRRGTRIGGLPMCCAGKPRPSSCRTSPRS